MASVATLATEASAGDAILVLLIIVATVVVTYHACRRFIIRPMVERLVDKQVDLEFALAKWRREAQLLAHDNNYQRTCALVQLVEDKLNIDASSSLTVNERAEKVLKIDAHLLRIMTDAPTPRQRRARDRDPKRIRDAKRMRDLKNLADGATTEHERSAAKRALNRLVKKYS